MQLSVRDELRFEQHHRARGARGRPQASRACTSATCTTAPALHHLVWEVVDNAVDEHLAGHCTEIHVTVHFDGSVTVEDNGRGIPVGIMHERGVSAAEVVMTVLHAGGKFDHASYKVCAGLHGVGVSAVNAVSRVAASSRSSARARSGSRSTGAACPQAPLERDRRDATRPARRSPSSPTRRSSPITEFSYDILASRLRELAFLNAGLVIQLDGRARRAAAARRFEYKGGIREFVALLNKTQGARPRGRRSRSPREVPTRATAQGDAIARRGRAAVERDVRRADLLLHEQRPQQGRRHAPHRPARRAHAHAQHLRHGAEPLQGGEERPHRARTCARA